MYASYGYGINIYNLGSINVFGFGIKLLIPEDLIIKVVRKVQRELRLCTVTEDDRAIIIRRD